MSGNLEFSRAKRFRFFAKPHKSQFDGNETTHVKENLTASIDGSYSVKADSLSLDVGTIDMNDGVISNVKNVIRSVKLNVAAPFTQTASQLFTIFRASPGDTIFNAVGKAITNFGQTATPQIVRISVGDDGDVDGFLTALNATPMGWRWTDETNAYKGAYFYNASRDRVSKTYATATPIKVKILASDMYLASLDVGEIEFYIDVMSRG